MQNKPTQNRVMRGKKPQISARTNVNIIIVALVLSTDKTVIPFPYVSKACMLGYKAGCSLTPISTAILVIGVVITYVVVKKKNIL